MSHEPDHITGDSAADDARRHRGPLKKVVDTLVGDPGGDQTDPRPVRGWEQPLQEQQGEPENEPPSRAPGEPADEAPDGSS